MVNYQGPICYVDRYLQDHPVINLVSINMFWTFVTTEHPLGNLVNVKYYLFETFL